jgi:UDPglucose 6-dehydrogenase
MQNTLVQIKKDKIMKQKNKKGLYASHIEETHPVRHSIKGISVVGLGKLGLCVATCLAYKGYRVFGVDIDHRKIDLINKGIPPIYEQTLSDMLNTCKDRLTATHDYNIAIKNSDATFIVVNTPSKPDGSYSLEQLRQASEEIGRVLKDKNSFHLVIVTSTVLPGTTNNIIKPLLEKSSGKKCGLDFGLCYNPEFIALGSVIHDFLNPDLILIGESNAKSGKLLEEIYEKICESDPKIVRMNHNNAELTKIALNSYVTMKISFANTIAELCEHLPNGNVDSVTSALGLDKRIGPKYLKGGLGFGGPCFPRDNEAFSYFAKQMGCEAKLAKASDAVNTEQIKRIVKIAEKRLNGTNEKIAILGLTYKPNTNVVEASQSVDIAKALSENGHSIYVYDPLGTDNAKSILGDKVKYAKSVAECIANTRLCIIATPWDEFKKLSPEDFAPNVRDPTIIDCWRILNREQFSKKMDYIGIGLANQKRQTKRTGAKHKRTLNQARNSLCLIEAH